VYRPPSSDNHYLNDLCDQLTGIVSSHPNSIIWVAGDINLPDIVWSDHSINGNTYPLNISNIFLNFLDTNGLCQIVSTPTRGTNVLDIFLTNRPSLIETCNVVDGISDHEAVVVKSNLMVKLAPPPTRTLYVWSQADFSMIRHTIQELCDNFVDTYDSSYPVSVLWNNFLEICNTCLELIPTRSSPRSHRQPWITRNVKCLSRKKQRVYNRAHLTNIPCDWLQYNHIKKQCRQECRSAYNN